MGFAPWLYTPLMLLWLALGGSPPPVEEQPLPPAPPGPVLRVDVCGPMWAPE